jgi:hypothetical protein
VNIYEATCLVNRLERSGCGLQCFIRRKAWAEGRYIHTAAGTDSFRNLDTGGEEDVNHRDCSANDWIVVDEYDTEIPLDHA